MRSILWVLLLIFFIQVQGLGQTLDLKQQGDQLIIGNSGNFQLSYLPSIEFQSLDWQPGYAYYLDGSSRQFEGMKYDPELDMIQVSTAGHILTLLPGVINGVSMESGETVIRVFVKVPLKKAVFMEALSVGKVHLMIYRKVKEEQEDIQQANTTIRLEKEEKIVEYEEFLYVWSKDGVKKLKTSKKSILSLMSDQEEKIELFINENKIKFNSVPGLMMVFDYYNNL